MALFCQSCGTQVADGAKFCPNCGNTVAAPASQTAPRPGQQSGAGTAAGSTPLPPGAPSAAPVSPAPAAFAPSAGAQHVWAPAPGHGVSPRLIAAAGTLGGIVVVIALIVFLGGGGHSANPAPAKQPPAQPPPTQPPPNPPPNTGSSGGIASKFPTTVANFTLDPASVQSVPALINAGATDAAIGTYNDASGGTKLIVSLGAFGDPSGPIGLFNSVTSAFVKKGCQVGRTQPLNDSNGTQVGGAAPYDCPNQGGGGIVLGIRKLFALFDGPSSQAVAPFVKQFFAALSGG